MKENKEKKSILTLLKNFGISVKNTRDVMQQCGSAFVIYTIGLIIILGVACVSIFLAYNKGQERVLVPDVVGSNIYRAQLLLQEKELYPKLQLRYSDIPGQAGLIISQNPKPGTVVKASSRVTLVVSRGIVFDHVGNYIGSNLDALKQTLDALYAGAEIPSLTIGEPIFIQDDSLAGTILQQEPEEGTPITSPVELKLVVSSGPQSVKVSVPDFKGKTISQVYEILSNTKLTVDFTQHIAKDDETPGTVVKQIVPHNKNELPEYSRITVEFAMPQFVEDESQETMTKIDITNKTEGEAANDSLVRDTTGYVHGILSTVIPEYPYAVPVKVDVLPQEGARYTLVTFNHIGGQLSVPYAAPNGSVLVLSVLDREVERISSKD